MARELCQDKSRNNMLQSNSSNTNTTGFVYPPNQTQINTNNNTNTHLMNQIQTSFPTSNPQEQVEIFNNTNFIGFSKNLPYPHPNPHHHHHQPKFEKTSSDFYQNPKYFGNIITGQENLLIGDDEEDDQDSPSLRCVFPCEGNGRPSQGLSLSLSSTNPTSIGLHSFELRNTTNHHNFDGSSSSSTRQGYFGKPANIQQEMMMMSMVSSTHQTHPKNSKYLLPAQELLTEFCSVQADNINNTKRKKKMIIHDNENHHQAGDDENGSSSSKDETALTSLDFMELQKRKTKLLLMLEELDRRYSIYCEQMRGVVSSFETVAGEGAALVYSGLASKAMSRHFRCLRDGIVTQIVATKKAMGKKDPTSPGMTRGETPRLKMLDQAFRQQRAYQQMNMLESHPWRPQRGLPERAVSVLRAWLFEHFLHPYPSDVDKHILARQTGLSRSQVTNWFINARVRLWKPMVEEMYLEETKEEQDNNLASVQVPDNQIEQKPSIDVDSLSSIINNNNPKTTKPTFQNLHLQPSGFGPATSSFGAIEMDFYGGGSGGSTNQNVSLTLGLQQHESGGVSLAFPPASHQSSLFEDCQQVHDHHYSLLDADQGQNLPYRNLMEAHLLHHLP